MDVLIVLIAWYSCGAIGSALALYFGFLRGAYPLDIDVGDIIFGAAIAVLGPICLFSGLLFFLGWLFRNAVNTRRIVFYAEHTH